MSPVSVVVFNMPSKTLDADEEPIFSADNALIVICWCEAEGRPPTTPLSGFWASLGLYVAAIIYASQITGTLAIDELQFIGFWTVC